MTCEPCHRTVAVLGSGAVGSTVAYTLAHSGVAERVILWNRTRERAEGHAWDIADAVDKPIEIIPTSNLHDLADAAVVVVTIGSSKTPTRSRLDIGGSVEMLLPFIHQLDEIVPDAILVIVSNPVDVLTRITIETSLRPANRVVGTGTALDTARLRRALASLLKADPQNVHAYVVGEHGDSSVVLWSAATIGPLPLAAYPLPDDLTVSAIRKRYVARTRQRGLDIMTRLGNTTHGIAGTVERIAAAVLQDQRRILTVSTTAPPEYNLPPGATLSVPCLIAATGIAGHLVVPRDTVEQAQLELSARTIDHAYDTLTRNATNRATRPNQARS